MCLPLLWLVGTRTLDPSRGRTGLLLQAAAAVLGCTGTVALTVLGTSRGDGFVAVGVLAGLVLLLRAAATTGKDRAMAFVLAGAVLGGTVGLKPTALAYALGGGLAVLSGGSDRLRHAGWLSVGGIVGYGVTGGWWALSLLQRFGNPIFPMANNVFQSDWAASLHYGQTYAVAAGPLDVLLRPYEIMGGDAVGWELPFGDDRLALAMSMAAVLAAISLIRRLRRGARTERPSTPGPHQAAVSLLLRFAGFSYLIWIVGSGYFRFLLPLEALVPVLLLVLADRVVPLRKPRHALASLLLLAALLPVRAAPGSRIPFGDDLLGLEVPELPPIAEGEERIVLLAGSDPLAFVASGFPSPSRFLCLTGNMTEYETDPTSEGTSGQAMQDAIRQALRETAGPLYVLIGPTGIDQGALTAYNLELGQTCLPVTTRIGEEIALCDVRRVAAPR
jgi:hypothetical protein